MGAVSAPTDAKEHRLCPGREVQVARMIKPDSRAGSVLLNPLNGVDVAVCGHVAAHETVAGYEFRHESSWSVVPVGTGIVRGAHSPPQTNRRIYTAIKNRPGECRGGEQEKNDQRNQGAFGEVRETSDLVFPGFSPPGGT
jgi:hypothetical protein